MLEKYLQDDIPDWWVVEVCPREQRWVRVISLRRWLGAIERDTEHILNGQLPADVALRWHTIAVTYTCDGAHEIADRLLAAMEMVENPETNRRNSHEN